MKNNIKTLRKKLGIRQEDLAHALEVSRQTINAIENDKYRHPVLTESSQQLLWQQPEHHHKVSTGKLPKWLTLQRLHM